MHGVRPLHDEDARVLAELPFEHPVAGVDGVDLRRVALEHAVGEPPGVRAQVGANAPGHLDAESNDRVLEFQPGAGDELSHRALV